MLNPKLLVLVATVALAGCGGTETKTIVQTQVVTQPPAPAPATTAPTETATPAPAETTAATTPAGPPLPEGQIAVEGRYHVTYKDYSPGVLNVGGEYKGKETTWNARMVCDGQDCRAELRRPLDTGGFKTFPLEKTSDRKYAGEFTGKFDCGANRNGTGPDSARQRVAVSVSKVSDIDGRPTAAAMDIYLTVTSKDCEGSVLEPNRGVGRWQATRIG